MNKLRKMIIERMSRVNECGGGSYGSSPSDGDFIEGGGGCRSSGGSSYVDGCGGGFSSGGNAWFGRRPRRSDVKMATAAVYESAKHAVKRGEWLEDCAKKAGKAMPAEMKRRLDALKKAASEFVALIDMYTKA